MSFEDEYAKTTVRKDPIRKFLPALGLILTICFAAISWAVHEPLRDLVVENISSLPREGEDGFEQIGYIVGGALFLVLAMFGGLLYAAFVPKPPEQVTEKFLKDEKRRKDMERISRKKRSRDVRKKMAADRRSRAKSADD